MDETESLKERDNHEIEKGSESEGSVASSLHRLKADCSANGHRISVTFWGTLAFIGMGVAVDVFGPTLLDLANHISAGVGATSASFAAQSIGSVFGCAISGAMLDRLEGLSFLILSVIIFSAAITVAATPFSVNLAMLIVISLFHGASWGAVDNGINSTLMKMWGQKADPSLQIVYFGVAFGGFFAPLIAKPFLSELEEDTISNNMPCNDTNSSDYVTAALNCSTTTPSDSSLSFAWAYVIAALVYIPSLVAFLYYAIRLELWGSQFREKESSIRATAPTELGNPVEENSEKTNSSRNNGRLYKITIYLVLFLFLFLTEGLVYSYGNLIFTVAVIGELNFSKDQAAHLTAVYWGAYAFMRVIPITLALLKVPNSIIMAITLIGSLIPTALMCVFPHDPVAIWIGTALFGTFVSPTTPTGLSLFNEYIEISGKATSVMAIGYCLGAGVVTTFVGQLIDLVTPDSIFYFTFGATLLSGLLMAIIYVTNFVHSRKRSDETQQYEKLN